MNPTQNEIGYSIKVPAGTTVGSSAVLGTLGDLYLRTNTTFALVFDILFMDDIYNTFFGGQDSDSYIHLARNKTVGKIDLDLSIEAGDKRNYTWDKDIPRGVWSNFIINGVGSGADGITLDVNGVAATASAQTNDAGYIPTTSLELKFGEVDISNYGDIKFAKFYAYARNLTATEKSNITKYRIYPSGFTLAWDMKRPNMGK